MMFSGLMSRCVRKTGGRTTSYFFEIDIRVPNFRPTPFEKLPKLSLARLFWKSRGLKLFVTLKTFNPRCARYLLKRPGRLIVFTTCISSETNVGKRPARFRGPTKLRSSSMSENGNPVLTSRTGDHVSPYFE